jgi:hypothetical protein
MAEPGRERAVLVVGDVPIDWSLARRPEPNGRQICACHQAGGAALLRDLIARVAQDFSPHVAVHPEPFKCGRVTPSDARYHHRFAIWSRYQDKQKDDHREIRAWRVEQQLPEVRADGNARALTAKDAPEHPDLVVINDLGLGFSENKKLWPQAISPAGAPRPWIVLRMGKPAAEGQLWKRLQKGSADRLILVVRIDELRLSDVNVSRELSWERTAQDLLWELLHNKSLKQLGKCAHVIVSFTTAGALVYSGPAGGEAHPSCRLVFDPTVMERMWNDQHKGDMIGGLTALTASIAHEVMRDPKQPDVVGAVKRGIDAIRALDLEGWDEESRGSRTRLVYPIDRIVAKLTDPKSGTKFFDAEVRDPAGEQIVGADGPMRSEDWRILEQEPREKPNLYDVAVEMVKKGSKPVLEDVPRVEFGKLLTFDRREIEGFQTIRALIHEYDSRGKHEDVKEPLSIAVFGPPGAGKSWSVTEIAKAVLPDRIEPITFNLSQFEGPKELIDAFHRVRDISLGGKLPLVFWDEFDTTRATVGGPTRLGWLPQFLSPMQDGNFQDGQITHPIGHAVFVFAGGTFESMKAFEENSEENEAVEVKAPDFVSRLHGYVDVLGPNPPEDRPSTDPYYVIRRAVMLRSLLERTTPRIFLDRDGTKSPEINEGVLRALLLTRKYKHGARSLTAIVAMSRLSEAAQFDRSDLPSGAQLDLHVYADDFLALAHGRDGAESRMTDPAP